MMDDERPHLVNVNKVAKNVLSIGRFGLFQIEDLNLIVTDWFMLSTNEEQFWKVQCKLEAKYKNVWLNVSKEGINICHGSNADTVHALYLDLVYEQAEQLKETSLTLGALRLFTDGNGYIGVQNKYLEMLDCLPAVKKAAGRNSVIVDDVHVLTPVDSKHTECKYLKVLNNMMEGINHENHINH